MPTNKKKSPAEIAKVLAAGMDLLLRHAEANGVTVGGSAMLVEADGHVMSMGRAGISTRRHDKVEIVSAVAVMLQNAFGHHSSEISEKTTQALQNPSTKYKVAKAASRFKFTPRHVGRTH